MECSFCGQQIKKGTGKIVITPTGKMHRFCSSKCEKNSRLSRDPRKVKWIKNAEKI